MLIKSKIEQNGFKIPNPNVFNFWTHGFFEYALLDTI